MPKKLGESQLGGSSVPPNNSQNIELEVKIPNKAEIKVKLAPEILTVLSPWLIFVFLGLTGWSWWRASPTSPAQLPPGVSIPQHNQQM